MPQHLTCNDFTTQPCPMQGVDADGVHAILYACTALLIGGLVQFYRFTDSWSLTSSLAESRSQACYTVARVSRYSSCVATSGVSKVRRAGRGKPVPICILAPSLCFTP